MSLVPGALLGAFTCVVVAGCGSRPSTDGGGCSPTQYPCGPYGTTLGQTIEDLTLQAIRDQDGDGSLADESWRPLRFSDVFGDKRNRVLVVLTSAEWCAPPDGKLYLADMAGSRIFRVDP